MWRRLLKLTTRQHGAITTAQLNELGISRPQIHRWLRDGRLQHPHRGVYIVAAPTVPPLAREMAAVLGCGRGAVLAGRSASALWGIEAPDPRSPVSVVVVGRRGVERPGIAVKHVGALARRDIRHRGDLPVLSPARTVLDRAAELSRSKLELLIDKATAASLLSDRDLQRVVAENAGRPGIAALRDILAARGRGFTREAAEAKARTIIRATELPPPEWNGASGGDEIDVLWRGIGLGIEIDGRSTHDNASSFVRDRRKNVNNYLDGLLLLRMTWWDLENPIRFATELGRAYERRRRETEARSSELGL